MSKKIIMSIIVAVALTGCIGPAKVDKFEEIAPNETAFVIPLEGASKKNQGKFVLSAFRCNNLEDIFEFVNLCCYKKGRIQSSAQPTRHLFQNRYGNPIGDRCHRGKEIFTIASRLNSYKKVTLNPWPRPGL